MDRVRRNRDNKRELQKKDLKNFPLFIEIKHIGYWITNDNIHTSTNDNYCDNNSVMLSSDCLLYVYKIALRHYLLSKQIISPKDIDPQNLVPHIVVRNNKRDINNNFDEIQNEKFVITKESLSLKSNFLLLELDETRNLHMTLIFSKRIGSQCNLIEAFDEVLGYLNKYPNMIETYKELEYFGNDHTKYWYNTPDSFPFKINKPLDYIPEKKKDLNYKTSAAGTIIND